MCLFLILTCWMKGFLKYYLLRNIIDRHIIVNFESNFLGMLDDDTDHRPGKRDSKFILQANPSPCHTSKKNLDAFLLQNKSK